MIKIRFQFLGLAQALESYHAACRERPISHKWDDQIKVIQRLYPQIPKGCINKIKEFLKPDFRVSVTEVCGEQSKIADKYLRTRNKKKKFSEKVVGTRNYYSHTAKDRRKAVVHEDKMFSLIRDLQLLLLVAIMKELRFTEEKFLERYPTDRW